MKRKKSRLDKTYKVSVIVGKKQNISFFRKKATANKYIKGVRRLEKKHKVKGIKILVRKPLRK